MDEDGVSIKITNTRKEEGYMSRLISVGIIGTGFGAKVHAPIINSHPHFHVKAISSVYRGNVEEVIRQTGIKNGYTNWMDMLTSESLDLVVIASAPNHHAEMVAEALKNHHVICEKPMAMNVEESLQMIKDKNSSSNKAAINFEFRFKPARTKVKEIIDSGLLGRIMHVRYAGHILNFQEFHSGKTSWKESKETGGGLLIAIGSHMIDSLNWWLKDPIKSVLSQTPTHIKTLKDREGNQYTRTADDAFQVIGELTSGTTYNIEFISRNRHYLNEWVLEIYGENGTIIMLDDKEVLLGIKDGHLEKIEIDRVEVPPYLPKECHQFYDAMKNTLDEILLWFNLDNNSGKLATFEDGLYVQRVLETIRVSADTGSKILTYREDWKGIEPDFIFNKLVDS